MAWPEAFVWLCRAGHESVISEAMMRLAIVQPRCQLPVCTAKLERKLRPYGERREASSLF